MMMIETIAAFKFPARRHLGLFETIGQRSDVAKSKMAGREKFEAIIISVYYNY